jgi:hypothetical protein
MGASLPFISLSLLVFLFCKRGEGARNAILSAALVWGVFIAATSELLSIGHQLTSEAVTIVWLAFDAAIGLACLWLLPRGRKRTQPDTRVALSWFERLTLAAIALIAVVVGSIALVAAPNNWDSMTYHMGRVVHWIQNQSVDFYPTAILRQLYMKPWSEYAIVHFQLLSGGDRFANVVQWMAMLGSTVGVSLIAKQLGADRRGQIFAAAVCATLPMGILQASSTQNDYVVAFWLVCFVYYVVRVAGQHYTARGIETEIRGVPGLQTSAVSLRATRFGGFYPVRVGASLGLAFLTKGTAYVYSIPFFAWYAVLTLRKLRLGGRQSLSIVAAIIVALNINHEIRNTQVFGHPLASGEDPIANGWFAPQAFFSNAIRNVAIHTGIGRLEPVVRGIHDVMGIDVNDPRTTVDKFAIPKVVDLYESLHEDYAGNPAHLVIVLVVMGAFLARRSLRINRLALVYVIALIAAFTLFCMLLRWAPHHSRIQLSLFVLATPLVGLALSQASKFKARMVVALLIVCSLPWVFLNRSRPFLFEVLRGQGTLFQSDFTNIFNTDRTAQTFRVRPELRDSYVEAASFLRQTGCKRIGLSIGSDDWEYPFWTLLHVASEGTYRLEHIDPINVSRKSPSSSFIPCAVIYVENPAGPKEPPAEWAAAHKRYGRDWSLGKVHIYVERPG